MWVIIRYYFNNFSLWLLYCYIETYLAGEIGIAVLDGVDKWPKVPSNTLSGGTDFRLINCAY